MINKIKMLCKKKNTTMAAVERVLGFSKGSICKWGTHAPSADKLQKVADYLDCTIEYPLGTDNLDEDDNYEALNNSYLELPNKLHKRLKELRREKGATQKDVAAYLQIDQSTYAGYESGKSEPSLDKLSALADYFGVSVDYLLGRTQPRHLDKTAATGSDALYYDLPPEALKELETYKEFLRTKYREGTKNQV